MSRPWFEGPQRTTRKEPRTAAYFGGAASFAVMAIIEAIFSIEAGSGTTAEAVTAVALSTATGWLIYWGVKDLTGR